MNMGRKKPTILRVTPARLITARMREDDKDDSIGNPLTLQSLFSFLAAVSMFPVTFAVPPLLPDRHRATPDNHEWRNPPVYQASGHGRNRACRVNLSVPLPLVDSF